MTSDDATEEAPSVDSDEDDEDLSSGFINAAQVKPGQVNKVDKAVSGGNSCSFCRLTS